MKDEDDDEDEDEEAQPSKVEGFSELTQRPASLLPLDDEGGQPPTAVLGGFNMHSFKGTTSKGDTERKLGALGSRLRGTVLDYSHNCEMVEIILPANFDTVTL